MLTTIKVQLIIQQAVTVNSLNVSVVENIRGATFIELTVTPSSNDVVPVRDQILNIDTANSIITVEAGGSRDAGVVIRQQVVIKDLSMFKFTDKISNLIDSQAPEFVVSDHPKFLEFVKSYFTFYGIARDFCNKCSNY